MTRFPIATRLALSAAGLLLVAATANAQTAQPMQPAPSAQTAPSSTTPSAPSSMQPSAPSSMEPSGQSSMHSSAQSSTDVRLHEADQSFITDGTKAVSTQRDAARIADSRSSDSQVKAFAERVVTDNAKISSAMRAASPRGVDVPNNDPNPTALDSIKDLRGDAFDKAYIEQVALSGEQKTLSVFQAEIASGRDQKLTSVARQALPILQAHYAEAQKLAARKHLSAQ
ncbi:DUF4142 domain-containing protein [Burkholderia guangdongensis]|uniref:DUF4142 domain-containing protein n=1 Tax=Burkholderia guangdongensis TaxID=1792500 RepID=UPI0015C971BA|nr:DUF4142 domain-containing protein [Burkholderia guangdongensis]